MYMFFDDTCFSAANGCAQKARNSGDTGTMNLPIRLAPNEFDLRGRSSVQMQRTVIQLACELRVGMCFVFLSDHDPDSINSQLQLLYRHQFFWNYLQKGPLLWSVQIGRLRRAM
jgi:uncharacterized protein (DUF2249 family)